jgi:hypothetical protein
LAIIQYMAAKPQSRSGTSAEANYMVCRSDC